MCLQVLKAAVSFPEIAQLFSRVANKFQIHAPTFFEQHFGIPSKALHSYIKNKTH